MLFDFVMLILLLMIWIWAFSFAPWLPTRSDKLDRIFELLHPTNKDIFCDLWCWDGRVVFYFANKWIQSSGYELAVFLYLFCRLKKFFTKSKKSEFIYWNFNNKNITDATIIYLFWMWNYINKNKKFIRKLKSELKPWTRIVSFLFEIEWMEPIICENFIRIYRI